MQIGNIFISVLSEHYDFQTPLRCDNMETCNIISNINIYIYLFIWMIAHLHKYVKFTSKIITCKTFLKNVLTYNFDYGTFKMQEQDRRSEYYAKDAN